MPYVYIHVQEYRSGFEQGVLKALYENGFYEYKKISLVGSLKASILKRLNPETLKPFVRGDIREDGWIFMAYRVYYLKKDGFFSELWNSPESVKTSNISQKKRISKKRADSERGDHLERRKNPVTGRNFKLGNIDEKGRYFVCYHNYSFDGEYFNEQWASPKRWHRLHVSQAVASARKRAKKFSLPFEITVDDAVKIFPKDNKCPALGMEMIWGLEKSRFHSPSLDRIEPRKGYVLGNICWISFRANIIKNDASADEILKVGNFLLGLEKAK